MEDAIRAFEADPDFRLRERVEALAVELYAEPAKYLADMRHPIDLSYAEAVRDFARRLRELLNPPRGAEP